MSYQQKRNQPSPGCKAFSNSRSNSHGLIVSNLDASDEFRAWFEGSRVVDGNGEPLVVYHGTETPIVNGFDPRKCSDNAVHFSSSYAVARWISNSNGRLGVDKSFPNVVPAYLAIKNPKVFSEPEISALIGLANDRDWTVLSQIVFECRNAGFDGIRLVGMPEENGAVSDHWLAFDGEQALPFSGPRERVLLDPANGPETVVGYHGTMDEFDELRPSFSGNFGPGFYFVSAEGEAEAYGERVIPQIIALKNPWRVSAAYDTALAEEEDFDSPSVDAVVSLYGGRQMMERAKNTWNGHYGQTLQDHLLRLGHDGIIATYDDGCQEIVAFDLAQLSPLPTHANRIMSEESFCP